MNKIINRINFLYGPLNYLSIYRFLPVFLKKIIALILSMALLIGTPGVIYLFNPMSRIFRPLLLLYPLVILEARRADRIPGSYRFVSLLSRMTITQEGFIRFTKKTLVSYLIASLILTGSGLLYLFNPFTKDVEAAWFDDSWTYRKAIEIATHTASENTVYINLTGVDDIDTDALTTDKLQADCGDLRFTKSNGELLPYYVVSGCDSVDTVIHVYFDTMPAGAQTIYFYYGNPSAPNGTTAADFSTEAANYTFGTAGSEEKGTAPVGYWKFDEGTDNTCSGGVKDACNSGNSGSVNDGASNNIASPPTATSGWAQSGVSGKSMTFDETNDFVYMGDTLDQDTNNFSISAWVKSSSTVTGNGNGVVYKRGTGSEVAVGYHLNMPNGQFEVIIADGTQNTKLVTGSGYNNNQWHHVVGVITRGTEVRIYVDGVSIGSTASTWTTSIATANPLSIGALTTNGTNYYHPFKGQIDEVKIYNYALTAAQVRANFASRGGEASGSVLGQSDVNENLSNGLVGYWKQDETSGDAADSSGNGATLTNNASTTFTTGKFSNGGTFNGTSQYFSSSSTWDDPKVTFTWATWFKPTADLSSSMTPSYQSLVAEYASASNYNSLIYSKGDGSLRFDITASGSFFTPISYVSTYTANTWYHVSVTRDNSSWKMYINGSQVASATDSRASTAGNRTTYLGQDGLGSYYGGALDEARVYNRTLSAGEVSQLYNFAPGPVGYWNFDEKTGTSAFDRSGNNNTATLTTTPTWTTGKYGSGINFAGSDQHVTRADDADFDFADDADMSFGAWFKHSAQSSGTEVILSKFNEAGYKITMETDGDIQCGLDYDSTWTPTDSAISTAGTYDDNLWHYASCVKSGASSLSLYIDGILIATDSSLTATNTLDNSDPLYIGIDADGTSNDWIGQIDEVKIYNYARSSKQVVEDMNAGLPAGGSPVGSYVAYWKMDEGYGTTANDSTSNANNLTLSSASWTDSGKFGKAWNGTNALWLSRADDADLDFGAAEDLAISLWYKSDSATNPGAIEYLVNKASATVAGYAIYANTDGTVCFGIDDDTTWSPDVASCTTTDVYDATWHHIAAIRNTTLDTTYIYIDGLSRDSDTDSTSATLENSEIFYVGDRDGTDNGDEFAGDIDEVKVYRLALTAAEVGIDMNQGKSLVLGALSDNSTYQKQAANQEYCIPGDTTSCVAPVARWDFEEGTGTSAYDESGNGFIGTLTNSPTWKSGKIGKAINFAGGTDIVSITDTTGSVIDLTTAQTFAAWIYPTSTAAYDPIFGKVPVGTASGYEFANSSGTLRTFLRAAAGNCDYSAGTLTANTWQYVVSTYDGTNVRHYINGVLSGTSGSCPNGSDVNDTALYIGGRVSDSSTFAGKIDNPKIFNYARTAAQVAWDYNRGAPVGWWKLDDCQGTTAYDDSRNGNNATNGNHGTITIGATGANTAVGTCTTPTDGTGAWYDGVAGKRNYSLQFDGTDDYVSIADPASGILDFGTGDFSVSAWVKTSTASSRILAKGGGGNPLYQLTVDANGKAGFYIRGTEGNSATSTSTTTITDGNWHLVTGVHSGTNIMVFVDGILQDTDAETAGTVDNAIALFIGQFGGSSLWFTGQIDDIKVFNYALTATQIKTLYSGFAVFYGPSTGSP
ncbi:MAG: DUF2341 domain-containing protein [Candidatus Daviesbacteria bacterium]|nr:DUF2341 domain-containing protein [Candidatus Daviesbacteria bacterium]